MIGLRWFLSEMQACSQNENTGRRLGECLRKVKAALPQQRPLEHGPMQHHEEEGCSPWTVTICAGFEWDKVNFIHSIQY